MRPILQIAFLMSAALIAVSAQAHQGPLDSHGCHPNVTHGTYHCHSGPLANQQYKSKADMLQALQDEERERNRQRRPKIQTSAY